MTDSGSKADGINLAEIRECAVRTLEGSQPDLYPKNKPKRKRGFHRALKAKKPWAVYEQGIKDMMNRVMQSMFENPDLNCPPNTIYGLSGWLTK